MKITDKVRNHQYEVGDVVTIISREEWESHGGDAYRCTLTEHMIDIFAGAELTIDWKSSSSPTIYGMHGNDWSWSPEMFQESYAPKIIDPLAITIF